MSPSVYIHPTNGKKVLILSSHTLSDYQQCARRYEFSTLMKIEPALGKKVFTRGTLWSKMQEIYYNEKKRVGHNSYVSKDFVKQIVHDILEPVKEQIRKTPPGKTNIFKLTDDEVEHIELRFMQYYGQFKMEPWVPIATEPELIKTFYEDDEYWFLYSGHPDLVVWDDYRQRKKVVIDHKTYERETRYYAYNNQNRGYLWLCDTDTFIYNYAGFQQGFDKRKTFFRDIKIFHEDDIKKWYDDTLKWFWRIAKDNEYERSWQCEGKWGICWYSRICEQRTKAMENEIIRLQYKQNVDYKDAAE